MKRQIVLLFFFLLYFCSVYAVFAQPAKMSAAVLGNAVITMKQEASKGFGGGINSPYTITLAGSGLVTFEGMDEGKAISRYDPPVKVIRKYRISPKQFAELVSEFYQEGFFSLADSYCCRDNRDGTFTQIADGGLATVVTSITIDGKTKSVTNYNFAPERIISLQRKIYMAGKIANFTKLPPYWLLKFPDEMFPPRTAQSASKSLQPSAPKTEYRKILRNSPPVIRGKYIDLNKRWGFIVPCVTTRSEVEKLLGHPINNSENLSLPIYNAKDEKIRVFYRNEKTDSRICNGKTEIGTVVLFSIIPIKDIRLSDLNVDLTKFRKDERPGGREISYNNQAGIFIETEIVEFADKIHAEMVTSIQFSQKIAQAGS